MSLRINKDNIFFILPEDRYSVSNRIDSYMAEDFTLYVKAKQLLENNIVIELQPEKINKVEKTIIKKYLWIA